MIRTVSASMIVNRICVAAVPVILLVSIRDVGCAQFIHERAREQWVALFEGHRVRNDRCQAVVVDDQGSCYVTGESVGDGSGFDMTTVKYDTEGNLQWESWYDGPASIHDFTHDIAIDSTGNVYVVGSSLAADYDYALIKYSNDGMEQWVSRYSGPGDSWDIPQAIALDEEGNICVTGTTHTEGYRYTTVKYDTNGNQMWASFYLGTAADDIATAIVCDPAGNVFVTGSSSSMDSSYSEDFATIKYDPDGNELWVARYDGPANSSDESNAIALDSNGNVYVTGSSAREYPPNGKYDCTTIKYDSQGNEIWIERYSGPHDGGNSGRDIFIDENDAVFIGGGSEGDFLTMRYDSDGNLLWDSKYAGPYGDDFVVSIDVDADEKVYVTGNSWGAGVGYDYATVGYAPRGVEMWSLRFNGPENDEDRVKGIGVDAAGNVYIAGETGSLGRADFAIIKYIQLPKIYTTTVELD
jgi:uncharacterized delta-60 repeat protein